MKKLFCYGILVITILSFSPHSYAQFNSPLEQTAQLLKKSLKNKEAIIWYLGHSGFAVKTRKHLMIFDYFIYGDIPAVSSLSNGFVNPEEIKGLDVLVFSSHSHRDHYDESIFSLGDKVRNITYILGSDRGSNNEDSEHSKTSEENSKQKIFMQAHEEKTIHGINILTIESTDGGVGFLLRVDDLTIFHGGDHALWAKPEMDEAYSKEIEFLTNNEKKYDIVFLASMTGNGKRKSAIESGIWDTVEKLSPQMIFLMHAKENEQLITEIIHDAPTEEIKSRIINLEKRGSFYFYKEITDIN